MKIHKTHLIKKITSMILAAAMCAGACSASAFAADSEEAEKEALRQEFIKQLKVYDDDDVMFNHSVYPEVLFNSSWLADYDYDWDSREVFPDYYAAVDNPDISFEELKEAYDRFMTSSDSEFVQKYVARVAYVSAMNDSNESGWYDEADWNEFVRVREELHYELEHGSMRAWNAKYWEMQDVFNNMVNKYTVSGDVNKDGKVDISDATLLQMAAAGLMKLSYGQIMLAKNYTDWYSLVYYAHARDAMDYARYYADNIDGYLCNLSVYWMEVNSYYYYTEHNKYGEYDYKLSYQSFNYSIDINDVTRLQKSIARIAGNELRSGEESLNRYMFYEEVYATTPMRINGEKVFNIFLNQITGKERIEKLHYYYENYLPKKED